ncbi:MAG: glutamate formimidoyltransferase [Terriglobia bacterium]
MNTLVECVPNFSEGKDRAVIDQIADAIQSVPGNHILDIEMDADHHRSVITFVGPRETIGEAAFRAIEKASQLIDLRRHIGAHPRIGATDVVPFIPLKNVTMEDCTTLARNLGQAVAERLSIPVYLYGMAAARPERVQLENVRKGQFEGLREEMGKNEERRPDYGSARIHPSAGATAIGARKFLIAYNINLNTPDVEIAKRIARIIRTSSGGMPHVKAMGVDLKTRNLAQVSMNLTDFEQTPMYLVFEKVKEEAAAQGVSIAGSEIVGLIPAAALEQTANYFLEFENFDAALVLENRLNAVLENLSKPGSLAALTVHDFIESVARAETIPGGGSVSAMAGALAAALGKMTVGFTLGRKKFESERGMLEEALRAFNRLGPVLGRAIDKDSQAYAGVMAALEMPKHSADEKSLREEKLTEALIQATVVPLNVAKQSCEIVGILQQLKTRSNPHLASDLKVGIGMGLAAVKGALENVQTNLDSLSESANTHELRLRAEEINRLFLELAAGES